MKQSLASKHESYLTTGRFAQVGRGYAKHCAPTAITNVIYAARPDLSLPPEKVFEAVAELGRRRLMYWNLRKTTYIGGTSDFFTGYYLRTALKRFGLSHLQVRSRGIATAGRVCRALARGELVYLQMHFHPTYHNHHLLIYGTEGDRFRAADGWRRQPTLLSAKDLRFGLFLSVR